MKIAGIVCLILGVLSSLAAVSTLAAGIPQQHGASHAIGHVIGVLVIPVVLLSAGMWLVNRSKGSKEK